jgi:hypothetical protein
VLVDSKVLVVDMQQEDYNTQVLLVGNTFQLEGILERKLVVHGIHLAHICGVLSLRR